MQRLNKLKKEAQKYQLTTLLKEILELEEILLITNEDEISVQNELNNIETQIKTYISNKKFDFDFADCNCFVYIQAGAGGVESFDWASMLLRMYSKFADSQKWRTSTISMTTGEEAGIKSCTIKISGHKAYGYLKHETGVHRLVRMSPFNSSGKRMTSFASVWVYPEIQESSNIILDKKDIKIDTFKSSGAGGQHVNTTDSAVRITHLETGIVVASQSSRSQHSNKQEAMKMLLSQLYQIKLDKQKKHTQNNNKADISWGNQIRSYILQPYTMVRDSRTDYKVANVHKILNGDIKEMLLSIL